jgi:four helix bundle protein
MFDHEKLDVYQAGLAFVKWVHENCSGFTGSARFPRDQIIRSSQSIVQNIAEGNGKRSRSDRRRYFEIARGSAFESAATIDILVSTQAVDCIVADKGKSLLIRIVSMLSRMTEPENGVHEESTDYRR